MGALTSGCDVGSRDEQPAHGPALHILATYPADGQGTDSAADAGVGCDTPTPDCAVPTDVAIELRFDRFLLPSGGIVAGLNLYTGDPKANAVSLSAQYDVVERVVTFHTGAPLQPNTLYTAAVVQSTDVNRGFWAFDRAPLAEGDVPLSFSFTTGSGPGTPSTTLATTDNCQTLSKQGATAGMTTLPDGPLYVCSSPTCHQNPDVTGDNFPPMGLSLTDWGLFNTAIGHVAHQTETGNSALNPGLESAPRFGVQMNLVDPGSPENSYLMYKLLRKPENYALAPKEKCKAALHSPVLDGACAVPDDDDAELVRLREWFVRGDPMPKDKDSPAALTRDDLVRVSNWIAGGAVCTLSP